MRILLQDLRYGFRMLARRPGFTLIALLALALGIGANTAVFSVIRGVLLRPLPFRDPQQLVAIWESNLKAEAPKEATSPLNFKDWRAQNRCFEDMAAMTGGGGGVLTGEGDPEMLYGGAVTGNFFQMFGIQAAFGRVFTAADSEEHAIVISDAFWTRKFGRDPNVLGKQIRLNGSAETIIGVLAANFQQPNVDGIAARDLFRPLHGSELPAERRSDFLRTYARMKPGVTLKQARAEMTTIAARLADQYPQMNRAWDVQVNALDDATAGSAKQPLWLLLGSAALLLLIACANVANLCLARASERHREFAIRAALGGGAGRLLRQLLTESLVLGLIGGAAGLILGVVTLQGMLQIGSDYLPRAADVHMDWTVMLFAFAMACLTSVLVGLLPARQAARVGLSESLKTFGRGRARSVLVAAEVGLTLILLAATGLLLRSFWSVQAVPLGFESGHILTAVVRVPGNQNDPAARARFLSELLERIERLPGVTSAGAVSTEPLTGGGHNEFGIEGRPPHGPEVIQDAVLTSATPDYFRTMGIGLRRGRYFTQADTAAVPLVALISEGLARRYFPSEDPLGHRISFDGKKFYAIAGIVADVHDESSDMVPMPQIYMPHAQFSVTRMALSVRSSVEPTALVSAVRGELHTMNPDLPLYSVKTMDALVGESVAPRRFALVLIGLFAGLALLVASIGIYGVISYSVTERTREFGLRMALGAMRGDVLQMVLGRGLRMVAIGIVVGLAGALAVTRVLASYLFGVSEHDPITFVAVAGISVMVAIVACLVPALRATRVDPMIALRYE
jgi:putative ABC transport system permease protein